MQTKTKPVIHLKSSDTLVLTNPTSGKQRAFPVHTVKISEDQEHLPVRLQVAVPSTLPNETKAESAEIGYGYRDNVDILVKE